MRKSIRVMPKSGKVAVEVFFVVFDDLRLWQKGSQGVYLF